MSWLQSNMDYIDRAGGRFVTVQVSGSSPVLPAEAHRGRIVMQLIEAQGELLPHREHHLGE